MALIFDPACFEVRTLELDGRSITYRAYEGIDYCEKPLDPIQKLNIYAPEAYFAGASINGYTLKTAPIFMPNTVGGYMQGPAMQPGMDGFRHVPNTAFESLYHGYVVACAGIRGRNTGSISKEFFVGRQDRPDTEGSGRLVGRAPAFIVDMKAAIRYLRANADTVPGDVERIITNGTSAGGALSALTGASGNSAEYAPYLEAIGAADARDNIFAASVYCPIHNLEHADMAYEWLFSDEHMARQMRLERTPQGIQRSFVDLPLTDKQIALSAELKSLFPEYVNSLQLTDEDGQALTLSTDGNGSFRDALKKELLRSAQMELDSHICETTRSSISDGFIDRQDYLKIEDGKVVDFSWPDFVHEITRMKAVPAFDALDLTSPENEEFGTEEIQARHFTEFSCRNSEAGGEIAEEALIRLMNPISQLDSSDVAPHWRIRHGSFDRDTSLAIPLILETMLKMKGKNVDFALPWGVPHSGDYDLPELFAWIDQLV